MNNLFKKWKELTIAKKAISIAIPVAIIAIVVTVIILINSGLFAKPMKFTRVEGVVTLTDSNGKSSSATENMSFSSGSNVSTGSSSLATIAFDANKTATLFAESSANFSKHGKKMELELTSGGVYFEISKPLSSDEVFDIKTSTAQCDVRGTSASGYIYINSSGRTILVLTSGSVRITGINAKNGQSRIADVRPGQRVTVLQTNDAVTFTIDEVDEFTLEEELVEFYVNNPDPLNVACAACGWDAYTIKVMGGIDPEVAASQVIAESEAAAATATETEIEETSETADVTTETAEVTETSETTATNETTRTTTATTTRTTTTTTQSTQATAATTEATRNPDNTVTPTPRATNTPRPTATPRPTTAPGNNGSPTPTTRPTPTSRPISTPTPRPTARPTNTPRPTATPVPETEPTRVDEPTSAPTPIPETEPTNPPVDPEPTGEGGESD